MHIDKIAISGVTLGTLKFKNRTTIVSLLSGGGGGGGVSALPHPPPPKYQNLELTFTGVDKQRKS